MRRFTALEKKSSFLACKRLCTHYYWGMGGKKNALITCSLLPLCFHFRYKPLWPTLSMKYLTPPPMTSETTHNVFPANVSAYKCRFSLTLHSCVTSCQPSPTAVQWRHCTSWVFDQLKLISSLSSFFVLSEYKGWYFMCVFLFLFLRWLHWGTWKMKIQIWSTYNRMSRLWLLSRRKFC